MSNIQMAYYLLKIYHAIIVREWVQQGLYNVHKSRRHYDGNLCFGDPDQFIVMAMLPTGQISNHYHSDYWNLFQCPEVPTALYEWDGHNTNDVGFRLIDFLLNADSPSAGQRRTEA